MLALITGATRGIGEAIAAQLARHDGMRVIVSGRDAKRGEAVAQSLHGTFRELDIASRESTKEMAAWLEKEGGLDILVNNAGVSLDGFNADTARRTLDVNFTGMMHLTDSVLPSMHTHGRIVMVSSGMGEVSCLGRELRDEIMRPALDRTELVAFADRFVADIAATQHAAKGWPANAYRVSKVAMNAYVRILARELRADPRKLLVNAACPGWVRTDMGGRGASRSPDEGAETPAWLARLPPNDERSGGFYRDKRAIAW